MLEELKPQLRISIHWEDPQGITWDGNNIWVSDGQSNRIYQLTRPEGIVTQEIACPQVRGSLAFDGKLLWQLAGFPKEVRRYDPDDGKLVDCIPLEEHADMASGLAVYDDAYYLGWNEIQAIEQRSRVDSNPQASFPLGRDLDGLERVSDTLWFLSMDTGLLSGLDAKTGSVKAEYVLPGKPRGLCSDGQYLWFIATTEHHLVAVLPE